jgi:hypothetical protein
MAVASTTGLGYSRYDTQFEDKASAASNVIGIVDREVFGCEVFQAWAMLKSLAKYLVCNPLAAIFPLSKVCYANREIKP